MMPVSFETSLMELGFVMCLLLVGVAVLALVLAVVTLPIFFFELVVSRVWFWAVDVGRGAAHGDRAGAARRATAFVLRLAPVVSLVFTAAFLDFAGAFGKEPQAVAKRLVSDGTKRVAVSALPQTPEGEAAAKKIAGLLTVVVLTVLFVLGPFPLLMCGLAAAFGVRGITLILRSITRNILRTSLTYVATFVLVFMVVGIWSILVFTDKVTEEKESDLKAIVTEKFQIPSQMPPKYEGDIKAVIETLPPHLRPKNGDDDIMTWSFVGGSLDPDKRTLENTIFMFCMEPHKVLTMMDGLDELSPEQMEDLKVAIGKMEKNVKAIVVGKERLRIINKRVGDKIKITSINYQDLEFEFEIIAEFPEGRYDQSAVMHRDYLTNTMKAYERSHNRPHPQANNCMNLIWIRLPNKEAFERMAAVVNEPGKFSSPAVKMETASSAINSFLDGFRDILNAMRWGLCPAIVACMTLVIANAISISVRERLKEMAVLKVLGFRPWMIMSLVLGEALLIGALSGGLSAFFAWVFTTGQGGVKFPIAFFPSFMLPNAALWWGPLLGILTALAGSILPALTARRIRASEVFAQVT